MKLALKWTVSLAIAAFFVWLSCRQWPVEALLCDRAVFDGMALVCRENGAVLWRMNLVWLVPATAVLVAVHYLRVLRWKPLVSPIAKFDFWTLNRVGAVSFLALFIFPFRLGELARPQLISRTGRIRWSAAFGTIAVERVMDGLMMALLLGGVLFLVPATNRTVWLSLRAGAAAALVVFSAAMGLLVVAYVSKRHAVRFVSFSFGVVSRRLADRLSGILEAFIDGMKAMPSGRHFAQFTLLTFVYWGINGFYYYFLAKAFGLDALVDVAGAYAMMAAVAVGMMIPNSPANVGSFWYFLLLPVSLYGTPTHPGTAPAFALVVWGLMLAQYAAFAGWFLVSGAVSLESLWSLQKPSAEGNLAEAPTARAQAGSNKA